MFLWSIALGAVLCVFYDVFRVLRVAVRHSAAAAAVEDILFALVCAVATLLYLIRADCGEIRIFVLVGELIGFVLYYLTVGALVIGAARGIISAVKRVFSFIWRTVFAPITRLLEKIRLLIMKKQRNIAICLKKRAEICNMHLKTHRDLRYNLKKCVCVWTQKKTGKTKG